MGGRLTREPYLRKNITFVWVFWQVFKNRTYIGKPFTRETLFIQEDHSLNSHQFENIKYRIALMFVLSQRDRVSGNN